MRQNMSDPSTVRDTSAGGSASVAVRSAPPKNAEMRTYPATRTGWTSRCAEAAWTVTWWARLAPADAPEMNVRPKSAVSASQGSAPTPSSAWSRSQERKAAPSSMAAGRRCSGARRYWTDSTTAGSSAAARRQ
uniref:Uncharacterized protein n=1 Tax=Triticum urartu TaxID=4572 RepID=A0A8R7TU37_TRIUA